MSWRLSCTQEQWERLEREIRYLAYLKLQVDRTRKAEEIIALYRPEAPRMAAFGKSWVS